ncbi:YggS family pyridoxal phosphate enzyme [Spirochaetia bacterium]|nr:YggS family pyridoxal phosphate enzyme [Spirochaetia bacterium]
MNIPPEGIVQNINRIRENIENICRRIGRDPLEIELMGVSKFHPLEKVEEAWRGGLRLFGESRVQEAAAKFSGFREAHAGAEIHLIGSLQRNKARAALSLFDCIQSVDRESLIEELGALTAGREKPLMILLEYHTGEESKAGFADEDALCRAAEKALSYPGLRPLGLMTMAPFSTDAAMVRAAFRAASAALGKLKGRFPGAPWSCLSMGMSGDYEIALEEGSTLVRIGTAIFGERNT